jgi:hypothetical protein
MPQQKTSTAGESSALLNIDALDFDIDVEGLAITVPPLKGEPPKAYKAFLEFCTTGLSLVELRTKYAKDQIAGLSVPTTERRDLNNWCDRYQWMQRRSHYDLVNGAKLERSFTLANNKMKALVSDASLKLLQRTNQMLDFPIEEQTIEEDIVVTKDMVGKTIPTLTIVKPADWNMATVATLLNAQTALDTAARKSVTTMIAELKKLGYEIKAPDGTIMATAQEILQASDAQR